MKKRERQREGTLRDSINQGINRVVINVSSARGYTARILEAEEIDLPGKSNCSHFYHLTSDTSGLEKKYRWSRNTCQIRKMCLSDFCDRAYYGSLNLSFSLSFSRVFYLSIFKCFPISFRHVLRTL